MKNRAIHRVQVGSNKYGVIKDEQDDFYSRPSVKQQVYRESTKPPKRVMKLESVKD
jgi:hypothetical protein